MESCDVGYGLYNYIIWCVWRPQVWVKEFSAWVVRYPTRRIVQQLDSSFWQLWQLRLAGWMSVSENKSSERMDGYMMQCMWCVNCTGNSSQPLLVKVLQSAAFLGHDKVFPWRPTAAIARVIAVHGTLCGLKAAQSPSDCLTLHSAFLLSQCVADEVTEMQREAACTCLPYWNWICHLNFAWRTQLISMIWF